jgi:transcriptional regulator GlxA family with amidase domain
MGLVPLASVPQVGVLVHQDATITSGLQALAVFASSNAVRAFTVADTDEPMRLGDALEIRPQFALAEAPALDVLVLSDGYGVWDDALIVEWVKSAVPRARAVIAVGRAAVVLSRAGFLAGERVPAERFLAQRGKELAPELLFDPSLSYRRAGKFHLARDAASTLEASLAVLYELTDPGTAERTADALGLPFGGAAEAK